MNQIEVKHEDKIRAAFTNSLCQIDVLSNGGSNNVVGEAKDYTSDEMGNLIVPL